MRYRGQINDFMFSRTMKIIIIILIIIIIIINTRVQCVLLFI